MSAGAPQMYYEMSSNKSLHFSKLLELLLSSICPCPLNALFLTQFGRLFQHS